MTLTMNTPAHRHTGTPAHLTHLSNKDGGSRPSSAPAAGAGRRPSRACLWCAVWLAWLGLALPATAQNAAPSFSSSATISVEENETAVVTVEATDSDADDDITRYAITGGADKAFFSIGAASGDLTFDDAPNFEDAQDQGTDNTYEVEVQATSGTGTRAMTATQTITATVTDVSGEAPGKPAAPTVTAASTTSLTVNWTAPDNAGPAITDYDVQYRAGNSGDWSDGGHTGTAVTATLTGLSENTSYQVQVRATNADGTGDWSDSGNGSTMPPDPPDGFMASNNNTRVTLTWNAPEAGADITRHEYRFKSTGDYPDNWTEIDDSAPGGVHKDWVAVTGLTNEVAYTFQLRAVNAAGNSTAVEAGPVTPTDGLCGRTEQVRDAIVAAISGVPDCADVTTAQLAGVTHLSLLNMGIRSLQSDDFSDLTALAELHLDNNELGSLPDDVFSGLTALRRLSLQDNELSSLPDDVFTGLTALNRLYLQDNELSSLPDDVFTGLTLLARLYLDNNELGSLPDDVFSDLTALVELFLDNNELSSLPDDVFTGLTALTRLSLPDNEVSSLPADVFSDLTALRYLHLQENELSSLPADVLSDLTALTFLYLQDNELSSLPADVFSDLTALRYLYLQDNELSSLPADVFSDLTALRLLFLANNELTSLPTGVFSGLTALEALNLNDNELSSLTADVFSDLTALRLLYLIDTQLTSLPTGVFSGLTALELLNLQDNELISLPEDVFSGLTALKQLYLGDNELTSLPEDVFSDLTALTRLVLYNTQLSELPADVFSDLTALEVLNLGDNELTSLPEDVFSDLTALTSLGLYNTQLSELPAGVFSDLTAPLEQLYLFGNPFTSLPAGVFSGQTALETLWLLDRREEEAEEKDPLPLTVTLEKVGSDQVRVKVLPGAPFTVEFPVTVANGALDGGATVLSVAAGSVEGTAVTVTRTAGTTAAVTADIDLTTQPTLPDDHYGYIFARAASGLPNEVFLSTDANAAPAFSSPATFSAAENQTEAGTVLATDTDMVDNITGYAITGGADQGFFSIGATSGALTFKTAPNYEDAQDEGTNNTYVVTVQATSGMGTRVKTATQTITVTVTNAGGEAPGKPAAPTVLAASLTSLTVNWSAPSNAGPAITDYDVQYRAGNSGGWSDGGHAGTAVTATLTGLSENTSYQVQVRATNDEGTGSWSDAGSGRTDANAAPSFSSSATFDAAENQTEAGTVLATDTDEDDEITGYAISGGADRGFFSIGATSGALTFDAAPNYEDAQDEGTNNTYVVEVQATSGAAEREKTATQTITVTVTDVSGEAPGKPGAPTVEAASATSLSVNWSAPDNAGPAITDYDVQYRAGNSGDWSDGGHAGTATTATLTGLSENTSYQVQVRATNAEGTGSWSDSGTGRTDANAAPSFSSSATFDAAENQTEAGTVLATDTDEDDEITGYAISGGADQGFFSIGATSGALTFDAAPNYEDAQDEGTNNTYVVEVQATSGAAEREKTATQTITVTVTNVSGEAPGKPGAPTVEAASATSLSVNWSAPDNAGPAITDYDVQYRAGNSGDWSDGGHAGTATTATLTGLSENTSYQVQVRATNAEGTGSWSDSGTGRTDANAAPSFSSSATFDAAENQTEAGTVLATDTDEDDEITGYAISGGADQGFFSIGATSGALTFDAAPNYEDAQDEGSNNTYVVEVQATSGAAEREKTATQTITVTVTDVSGEAPGKPGAPTVSAASATSLGVNWSAPDNAGPPITDYDVQYRAGNSGGWSDGAHAGTAVTATLTGLSENTSYQVQVRATNDEGTGDWSNSGSGRTDANAPPPPQDLQAEPVAGSSTSVTVTWTAPEGGLAVTGYELRYREQPDGAWVAVPHNGTATTATITGLEANTAYRVEVRALSERGSSSWTALGNVRTGAPPIPPTVESLQVRSWPQRDGHADVYGFGETIVFTLTLSAKVRVTGQPQPTLAFDLDGDVREARYWGLSDTDYARGAPPPRPRPEGVKLHFGYTVRPGDRDDDGVAVGSDAIRLGGARIRGAATDLDADLAHAAVGPQSGHKVDGGGDRAVEAGVTIIDTDGNPLALHEDGRHRLVIRESTRGRYGLKLDTRPTHTVHLRGIQSDGDEDLRVLPTHTVLPIAPDEWETPIWMEIRASPDDDAVNGERVFLNRVHSRDPDYNDLILPDVLVVEDDDDVSEEAAAGEGFSLDPENTSPSGIWSDGQTAWVADLADARLYAYSPQDGERQPEKDIATEPSPMGLWSDGETLWVARLGGGLRAHRLADGARLPDRDLSLEANAAPAGVWSDGVTAWVSEWLGDTVHAYRLSDGRRKAGRDIEVADGNLMPVGLWSDGETLWVADWRERMFAYRLSDGGREPGLDVAAGEADADPTGLWSGGGTLLSTGWEDGEVRAYRLPALPALADGPGKGEEGFVRARAASLPPIADPALAAAIGAALGKVPGEPASPAELAGLETLQARNAGIRDLAGLERATGLKVLDLGFNPLADLRPLAALPALEQLNLDGAVPDPQDLAALTGLKRLSLRHNGIRNLGVLAGLAQLEELDAGDNRVADLWPLAGLRQLEVLRADRNRIADLWPLASLARLEALELGANRIGHLQPLSGLVRLRTLRLAGNGLRELYPLSGLEGLRDLGLAGNSVEDLRSLSDLGGLRRLDLRGNPVGDLRPLQALGSLAWVHVGGTRIEDLAPLDGLQGLTVAGRDDLQPPAAFGGTAGPAGRD